MNSENIKFGDWVYLKSNPEIKIKVKLISNEIVDFRNQRTEEPCYAYIQDLVKITDESII